MNFHVGDGRRSGKVTASCDNVIAWRIGEACQKAAAASAGDYIDRGLALLHELEAKGFDIVVPGADGGITGDGRGEAALPDEWPAEFCVWYRDLPEVKPEKLWPYWAAVHAAPPQQQQASPVPDGWMPIETAPKDGSYFLMANQAGVWVGTYEPKAVSGYVFDNPWRSRMLNHWHITSKGHQYKSVTHWMPLPAAPKVG